MTVQVQTKLRPTPIYDVLSVLGFVCPIFGQKSLTKMKNGQYKRSYLSAFFTLFHLSSYATCLYFKGQLNEYDFPSAIVVVLKKVMFIGNILVMMYVMLVSQFSGQKETEWVQDMEKIDSELFEIKARKQLNHKNDFVKRVIFIVIFFNYLLFYVISTTALYFCFKDIQENLNWQMYEIMVPIMIISTMKTKFYIGTLVLRTRSEIINQYLIKRISACSSQPRHLEMLEKDIEAALKIHKTIVDTVRTINKVFGFMILITFILSFILLLSDAYIVLYCLTVGKENNIYHILSSARLLVFYIIELLVLMRTTTLLCSEVNETKNILFQVKIEPDNVDTRNLIMVSVFKLMHDKLELKACELFDMDLSFVFSMFASLTTYLLILLQFDIDSIQRNALKPFSNLTLS